MKKTILVTGANRGIGLAIVKGLAEDDKNLVLLACRDIEKGRIAAQNLKGDINVVELDLSSRELINQHMTKIQVNYKIDILINNAGILIDDDFEKISHKKLDQVMMVNTIAPLEMIRLVLPQMKENQFGRIINMSSGLGSFDSGLTGPFSYSLSKASLNALTLTISQSLPENVTINSMCPGWVRTDMGGESADRSPEKGAETAIWLTEQDNGVNGKFFRDKKEIVW